MPQAQVVWPIGPASNHDLGVQPDTYSIMTNQWVWHPAFDFAADHHGLSVFVDADNGL
jgi:hypothetical protein